MVTIIAHGFCVLITHGQFNEMSNTFTIDLQEFSTHSSEDFKTGTHGTMVRIKSGLDTMEPYSDKIIIRIPADVISLSQAFLEELLENTIVKLREDEFLAKVQFERNGRYDITSDLKEVIEKVLRYVS